jgi:hypothetical protein
MRARITFAATTQGSQPLALLNRRAVVRWAELDAAGITAITIRLWHPAVRLRREIA